jgi:hypothetical protein
MFPSASAEYEFTGQAFNEFCGFVKRLAMVLENAIGCGRPG